MDLKKLFPDSLELCCLSTCVECAFPGTAYCWYHGKQIKERREANEKRY